MQLSWPALTLGRLIALVGLLLAILSLVVPLAISNLTTWLLIGAFISILIG